MNNRRSLRALGGRSSRTLPGDRFIETFFESRQASMPDHTNIGFRQLQCLSDLGVALIIYERGTQHFARAFGELAQTIFELRRRWSAVVDPEIHCTFDMSLSFVQVPQ